MNFKLRAESLADGSTPDLMFHVENTRMEGPLTTAAIVPKANVAAISVLTDPRQYRLILTAVEQRSGFISDVKVRCLKEDVKLPRQ